MPKEGTQADNFDVGKAGNRNFDDLAYGGADTLSAEQLATAEYLSGNSNLSLEIDVSGDARVAAGRANRAPTGDFEGRTAEELATADAILAPKTPDAEAVPAKKTRAELDNDMKVNLLGKKIAAQLSGDTAEDARLDGMLAALEARIAERGDN